MKNINVKMNICFSIVFSCASDVNKNKKLENIHLLMFLFVPFLHETYEHHCQLCGGSTVKISPMIIKTTLFRIDEKHILQVI